VLDPGLTAATPPPPFPPAAVTSEEEPWARRTVSSASSRRRSRCCQSAVSPWCRSAAAAIDRRWGPRRAPGEGFAFSPSARSHTGNNDTTTNENCESVTSREVAPRRLHFSVRMNGKERLGCLVTRGPAPGRRLHLHQMTLLRARAVVMKRFEAHLTMRPRPNS